MFTSLLNFAATGSILQEGPLVWGGFLVLVVTMLLADILVINRKPHAPSIKEATVQSLAWISLGIGVGGLMWWLLGGTAATQYFTGYAIEKSLSVDNIFVWSLVFGFFAVPTKFRHRVLYWGIFGAKIMRFLFIATGVTLIQRFEFVVLILGALLLYSAYKLIRDGDEELDVSKTRSYKFFTKYIPTTKEMQGPHFFSRIEGGVLKATPLFLCLLVIEITDVIFAVDSIPAILAISNDIFVIFASNVMAILGLRSLFFLFDAIKDKFSRLNQGLAVILGAVGIKMILGSHLHLGPIHMPGLHVPTLASLGFVLGILVISVLSSMWWPPKEN
jgi:tellurite resistance protein TerC